MAQGAGRHLRPGAAADPSCPWPCLALQALQRWRKELDGTYDQALLDLLANASEQWDRVVWVLGQRLHGSWRSLRGLVGAPGGRFEEECGALGVAYEPPPPAEGEGEGGGGGGR